MIWRQSSPKTQKNGVKNLGLGIHKVTHPFILEIICCIFGHHHVVGFKDFFWDTVQFPENMALLFSSIIELYFFLMILIVAIFQFWISPASIWKIFGISLPILIWPCTPFYTHDCIFYSFRCQYFENRITFQLVC